MTLRPQLPKFCWYYSTKRKVRIGSTHVGLGSLGFWYRLTQSLTIIVALVYTIGYNIVFREAYKEFDTVTSDVRGSLVGALQTEFTEAELDNVDREDLPYYNRFWDLTKNDDFAPEMENSFFVPTNVFITTNQKRGLCPDFTQTNQTCINNYQCVPRSKKWAVNNHGVRTGRCIRGPDSKKSCEVSGWCPLETRYSVPSSTRAIFEDTKNFQIHITSHVQFTKFNLDSGFHANFYVSDVVEEAIRRFNMCKRCASYSARISDLVDSFLGDVTTPAPTTTTRKTTTTKRTTDKSWWPFGRNDGKPTNLRKTARVPKPMPNITYHDIAMKGAVINTYIHWSCYLGLRGASQTYFRKHCKPTFTFDLMPSKDSFKDLNRKGLFVHKPYHDGNGDETIRTLYKTYGIWFRFSVSSEVSRFNLMDTFKVLFVGLGLIKVSDMIFTFLAPKLCCKKRLESEEYIKARYVDIWKEKKSQVSEYTEDEGNGHQMSEV